MKRSIRLNSEIVRGEPRFPRLSKKNFRDLIEPKKYKFKNKQQTLKNPLIFYTILEFLDDETIYETKHVCKSMMQLIKKNEKFDYKSLKILLARIRFFKVQ